MYIPLLKLRETEKSVVQKMNHCFTDEIIPLFEVFSEVYKHRYKTNPVTGEYIYQLSNNRRKRIKVEPTDEDIITLEIIDKYMSGRKIFIDYFRIDTQKYQGFNAEAAELGLRLLDFDYYCYKLQQLSPFDNFIPVVSVRRNFGDSKSNISKLVKDLQAKSSSIAFRLTTDLLSNYNNLMTTLRSTDYLLFDIEETDVDSLFLEIDDLMKLNISAKKIILNSPRKSSIPNKDYEEEGITQLIDNSILEKYRGLGFDGFGDYAGYKDTLPKGGGNYGSALGLIYDLEINKFWAFTNKDTSLGIGGYPDVKLRVLHHKPELDPDNTCVAYKYINEINSGTHKSWIQICMMRYIDQIYKSTKLEGL